MPSTASSASAASLATLKWLWISVGALSACVLALSGTLLAQKLPDASQPQAVAQRTPESEIIDEKSPQALASQALKAPNSGAQRPGPAAEVRPALAGQAPVCATCGRVESVQPVTRSAPATGVGAVAAGVLGAVGGGYVGHQVEQRARTTTVYQMRVRMDDGSLRTFTRAQPVAEGTPVRVEGKSFRVDQGAAQARTAQLLSVADRGY